jgi:hypothetical protein
MNARRRGWGGRRWEWAAAAFAFAGALLLVPRSAFAQTPAPAPAPASGAVPIYIQQAGQGLVTPPAVEDVEHMCALLSTCPNLPLPPDAHFSSVSGCVQALMGVLTAPGAVKFSLLVRDCGLSSNSCGELKKCMMAGAADDVCQDRGRNGPAGRCDDAGRAINCDHEKVIGIRNCPKGGEQCVVREGQASCVLGPCTADNKEGSPPACSASGTRILQCDHGKLTSFDCAAFGLKCMVTDGKASCAPPTTPCSGASKRCDGNAAVGCVSGHEVKVDCGAAGLSCKQAAGSIPVGACYATPSDADKCDPKDAAKCDGATIRYCFAGKKRSYFCRTLGFNTCVKDGTAVRCGN